MSIMLQSQRHDILSLYLLRFVCALMIVVHHSWSYFFGYNITTVTHYELDIAVDFFFVLSGMMMYYIYPVVKDKTAFLLQRIGKLWPLHLVTAAITLLFFTVPALNIILANLFCVQSFIPYPDYYFSLNHVSWCVCAELFFYLCYVLGYKHIFKSLTIAMLINAILFLIWYEYSFALTPAGINASSLLRFLPLARVFEFFAGCCTAYFIKKQKEIKSIKLSNILVALGIILILVCGQYIRFVNNGFLNRFILQYYKTIMLCVGIFLCCYPCTFLPKKTTVFFGKISFAIFMTHQIIVRLFQKYNWFDGFQPYMRYIIYSAMVLFIGWLTFRFIEEPAYRFVKNHMDTLKKHVLSFCNIFKWRTLMVSFLVACFSLLVFYPVQNNKDTTLVFNVSYEASNSYPHIKIYYDSGITGGFSEIETKKVILDKSGRTEVTIRTPEIQKLRFSFLNFKEITVSDLYAIGQQFYPINIDDIKVVDANISVKNNGFSVYPNGQHGYVVFENLQPIYGKYSLNHNMIWWAIFLTFVYNISYNIIVLFMQRINILKKERIQITPIRD